MVSIKVIRFIVAKQRVAIQAQLRERGIVLGVLRPLSGIAVQEVGEGDAYRDAVGNDHNILVSVLMAYFLDRGNHAALHQVL